MIHTTHGISFTVEHLHTCISLCFLEFMAFETVQQAQIRACASAQGA